MSNIKSNGLDIGEDPLLALPNRPKFKPNHDIYKMEGGLFYKYGFAPETELEWDPSKEGYDVRKLYAPVRLMDEIPDVPNKAVTSPEYVFWKTWMRRMMHGWIAPDGRYLTPVEVFKLNFVEWRVRNPDDPTIFDWFAPKFRDNDHEIHSILWNNRMKIVPGGRIVNAKNHVEAKARGIGWSITDMTESMWDFVFGLFGDSIARAYPDEETIFKEKNEFGESWNRLHPFFRSVKEKGRLQEMEVIYSNKGGAFDVGFKTGKNTVIKRSCSFDEVKSEAAAGVYKGDRKMSITVVEAGKWKKGVLMSLFEKNERCILSGDTQWGCFRIGGTSDKITSNDTDYKYMIENHETFNSTLHLSNAGVCQTGFINNNTGESDYKGAIAAALKRREEKSGNPERLQAEISENPIFLSELLTPKVSYAYDKQMLIAQEQRIKDNRLDTLWVRGRIDDEKDLYSGEDTGFVKFVEDEEGRWLLNKEAMPLPFEHDNLDIAGIDDRNVSYQPGTYRRERDSKNAMIIWRRKMEGARFKTNVPAAVYFSDEPDLLSEYKEFIRGIRLYDCKQVINEKNNLAFYQSVKAENLECELVEFDGSPGIKVTTPILSKMTLIGNGFLVSKDFQNMTSLLILDGLKVWGSGENTDIGSAIHLIFFLDEHMKTSGIAPEIGSSMYMNEGVGVAEPRKRVVLGSSQRGTGTGHRLVRLGPGRHN